MSTREPEAEMLRRMLPLVDPDSYPVPEDVLRVAEGLFYWKSVAADLAVLESSDEPALTAVRGSTPTSRTSCTLPGETAEIEIEYFGPERLLVVDVGAAPVTSVRLSRLDATDEALVAPDAAGICRFTDIAPGRVFLVFDRPGAGLTKTEPLLLV